MQIYVKSDNIEQYGRKNFKFKKKKDSNKKCNGFSNSSFPNVGQSKGGLVLTRYVDYTVI